MTRIYLDHNATSELLPEVREALRAALSEDRSCPGNPSSPHRFGHEARIALEEARKDIAGLVGAAPSEICFVSGGTEANNQAILGRYLTRTSPGHIVTSAIEHPSVLEPCRLLESRGWSVTYLPVDRAGQVRIEDLEMSLRPETALVTIMLANNETGILQPVEQLAAIARARGVPFHTDAVQAAGRIDLDCGALGDMVSLSAHKLGGPVGIGALRIGPAAGIEPLLRGGTQESRRRPGTEPVWLASGFAIAARHALETPGDGAGALRDRLEAELIEALGEERVEIHGASAPRLPNTSCLALHGVDAEALVVRMDLEGVCLSTGSACSTGSARPSHVLRAMGGSDETIRSTIRISLGPSSTGDEIEFARDRLVDAVRNMAAASAAAASAR